MRVCPCEAPSRTPVCAPDTQARRLVASVGLFLDTGCDPLPGPPTVGKTTQISSLEGRLGKSGSIEDQFAPLLVADATSGAKWPRAAKRPPLGPRDAAPATRGFGSPPAASTCDYQSRLAGKEAVGEGVRALNGDRERLPYRCELWRMGRACHRSVRAPVCWPAHNTFWAQPDRRHI
jgi:hypothetical protein